MVKGLFVGLAVVVVLAIIPVVHFIGVPAGPFIAGYFGINASRENPGSPGRKALTFGIWMGIMVGTITVIGAVIVTLVGDFGYPFLLWGGVVVATFYYSSMSALGAWYSGLRALERVEASAGSGPTASGARR